MGRYVLRRHIATSPERVFEGFTLPAVMVDWMDLAEIRDATGPLDRAGTRYRMVVRGLWQFAVEVVRSEPPDLIEYRGRGPLGATVRIVASVSVRDGGVDLEQLTEYSLPLGALGRWLDRRFVDKGARPTANRELDRLVAILTTPANESTAPPPRA